MNTYKRRIRKLPRGTQEYWVSEDYQHVACFGQYNGRNFLAYDAYQESGFDAAEFDSATQDEAAAPLQVRRAGQEYYVAFGRASLAFDEVKSLVVSAAQKQFAFAGRRGELWHWIMNDEIMMTGSAVGKRGGFFFSPDGKRWLCSICRDDGWYVLLDGCEYGPFEAVKYDEPYPYSDDWCICFSPDSRRASFAACRRDRWFLFCEGLWFDFSTGQSSGQIDDFSCSEIVTNDRECPVCWTYSLDGTRWAAANDLRDEPCRLIVDGVFLPHSFSWLRLNSCHIPYEQSSGNDAFFSPNGRHYACPVEYGGASYILLDGELIPAVAEDLNVRNIFWAPDGEHFNYLTMRSGEKVAEYAWFPGGSFCMVLDGKPGPEFGDLDGGLYYSPDGSHTAYVGTSLMEENDGQDHMVVDGVLTKHFEYIEHHDHIGFLQDNTLYFISADATGRLQFNDHVLHHGKHQSEAFGHFSDLQTSPDNSRMAVCGSWLRNGRNKKKQRQDALLLSGKTCPVFSEIRSYHMFSPDSRHHLWEVDRGTYYWLLLDGKILFGRTKCIWYVRFTPDSRYIEYIAEQDRRLQYRKISVAGLLKGRKCKRWRGLIRLV